MALITFEDLPSTNTPINSTNLNNNFNECFKTGDVVYSGDITDAGNYSFTTNISDYRFLIIELTSSVSSQRAYCIVPGNKIVSDSSMWISSDIEGTTRTARIASTTTYLNVLSISSGSHIRNIYGIL